MSSGTASTNSLVRMEDIARMEEEIHRQTVFLSNLRAKRNSFLLLFSLPCEILEVIFIHGARDYHYHESRGRGWSPSGIPTWVNVSYVCRHWRNIALHCPILWTYHFNLSLRWTEELLFRSKEASLKICITPYTCRYDDEVFCHRKPSPLDALLRHTERIEELHLEVSRSILPATLSLRAPRLEILEIHLYEHPRQCLAITDADTPVLQTLILSRCLLPWRSLNLTRLKTLVISDVCVPPLLNIFEFFAVLGGMQDLTSLYLIDFLPSFSFSHGALGLLPKSKLPRLALLVITSPLSMIIAFLHCVDIPSDAQVSLREQSEHGSSTADYAPISSSLIQRYHSAVE